jgi:ankyrin repeat protein
MSIDDDLVTAAKEGYVQRVVNALAAGAKIHYYNDRPLRWACNGGHMNVVEILLKNGVDASANNSEPLRETSERGHIDVVKLLIKAGADVTAVGNYALRYAAAMGRLGVVIELLKAGADPSAEGGKAVRWAQKQGHHETAKLLKDFIAHPNMFEVRAEIEKNTKDFWNTPCKEPISKKELVSNTFKKRYVGILF